MVYASMIMLGLGYLAPYNSVLTAVDYFSDKFGSGMEYYLAAALVCPNVIFLAISVVYGLPLSERACIVGGFLTLLLGCASMPILQWEWSILLVAFLMGLATAMTQGTLFSICGVCGPSHTAALTTGTGMAGTLICLIRMATKGAPSEHISVISFFSFSAVLCVACVGIFILCVESSEFYLHRQKESGRTSSDMETKVSESDRDELEAPLTANDKMISHVDADGLEIVEAISTKDLIWKLRIGIVSVVLVFLVTLALFPGVISEMKSSNIGNDWWSLILFTIFNFTDTVGKFVPSVSQPLGLNGLLIGAVMRVAFLPLLIICVSPSVISWDWVQALLVAAFGISNGFLGTVAMMLGPEQVDSNARNRAGLVMVFFLTSGLAVGSWVGVGLKQAMDKTSL